MRKSRRSPIRPLNLIQLRNVPILEQLQLEEALLRADDRSFCIINYGSPRAIVMGISGVPEELIDIEKVQHDRIPVIKRFSGGGTVIVDENTLFVTFILSKELLDITPFPEPVLRWGADLYARSWGIPNFQLQENDYVIGERKCGGNAQYFKKERFLHHTSFLFDYSEENMEYLLLPRKRPQYRNDRPHKDFLIKLKDHVPHMEAAIQQLIQAISGDPSVANVKRQYNTPQTESGSRGPLRSNVKRLYIENFDLKSWRPAPHRKTVLQINAI